MSATPGWSWPIVALCVAAMIFWRPAYQRLKHLIKRVNRSRIDGDPKA